MQYNKMELRLTEYNISSKFIKCFDFFFQFRVFEMILALIFFIIKSFTEEDVHKAVKYGIWSSTAAGNQILNKAFLDV